MARGPFGAHEQRVPIVAQQLFDRAANRFVPRSRDHADEQRTGRTERSNEGPRELGDVLRRRDPQGGRDVGEHRGRRRRHHDRGAPGSAEATLGVTEGRDRRGIVGAAHHERPMRALDRKRRVERDEASVRGAVYRARETVVTKSARGPAQRSSVGDRRSDA